MPDDVRIISTIDTNAPAAPITPAQTKPAAEGKSRRAKARRSKGEIIPLPFVSPGGNNWWSVHPTGYFPADRAAGIAYAWQFLDFAISHYIKHGRKVVPIGLAGSVMRDMIRSRDESGMSAGFLEGLLLACLPLMTHETVARARAHDAAIEAAIQEYREREESRTAAEKGSATAPEA